MSDLDSDEVPCSVDVDCVMPSIPTLRGRGRGTRRGRPDTLSTASSTTLEVNSAELMRVLVKTSSIKGRKVGRCCASRLCVIGMIGCVVLR